MENQMNNVLNQNICCKHCGAQNSNNSNLCSSCGNSLIDYNQNNTAANIANYVLKNKVQLFSQFGSQNIVQDNVQSDIQNSLQENNDMQDDIQNSEVNQDKNANDTGSVKMGVLGIIGILSLLSYGSIFGVIILVLMLLGCMYDSSSIKYYIKVLRVIGRISLYFWIMGIIALMYVFYLVSKI